VQLELYDEETGVDLEALGIATLPPLEPVASGPEAMVQAVAAACQPLVAEGRRLLVLGGEHTVTLGVLEAHRAAGTKDLHVLQLDAHADFRDSYQGSRFSHACVMARVAEMFPYVQVGVRSLSRGEAESIDTSRILWARDLVGAGEAIGQRLDGLLGDPVYVTLDLDVLDPGLFPATGTPEPGGLGWYDILSILRHVGRTRRVVGMDVMEHCPRPGLHAADFVAARLVAKMIAYAWG
jgi:agmatinase